MSVAFITHPDCLLHGAGIVHPERPQRISAIQDALIENQLASVLTYYEAPLVEREFLNIVHAKDYVDMICSIIPAIDDVWLDPDTFMTAGSLTAALRAAGANTLAIDLLIEKKAKRVFSAVRPPGHHAEHNRAMGFCLFNNIAVAAAYARMKYSVERIAIIDFDVHHGNGTEDIFLNEPNVLFCSLFQHPFYPHSEVNTQSKHIVKIPLKEGTKGDEYRRLFTSKCVSVIKSFEPQLILVSAGFDAHIEDDLAGLCLVDADYAWLAAEIKNLADQLCDGKVAFTLEGGYNLSALKRSVSAVIKELIA